MELPVVDPWFTVEDVGGGVTRLEEAGVDPQLRSNIWHLRGAERDLLVDAGNGIGPLGEAVGDLSGGRPVVAVATHAHYDHVGGLGVFEDRRCHEADAAMPHPGRLRLLRQDFPAWLIQDYRYYGSPLPDEVALRGVPSAGFDVGGWSTPPVRATSFVRDGESIELGDRSVRVVHTPGHTAGSICLWDERSGLLFSGDALYLDDRLEWEDGPAFRASLARLRELPARIVHAGHGPSFGIDEMRAAIDQALATV